MDVGTSATLLATAYDAEGRRVDGAAFSWAVSNSRVATVSRSGVVRAVAPGAAVVTATWKTVSATAPVIVRTPLAPPSLRLAAGLTWVYAGNSIALAATAFDTGGKPVVGAAFAWTVSDPSIATVSGSGVVTGVAPGAATVTVTWMSLRAEALVVVLPAVGGTLLLQSQRQPTGSAVLRYDVRTGVSIPVDLGDANIGTVAWSHDGTRLAVSVWRQDASDAVVSDIYVVPLGTSSDPATWLRVTDDGTSRGADWSPGDDRVVYVSDGSLRVAPVAGGPPVVLTTGPVRYASPRWSPDGSTIAAVEWADAGDLLVAMNVDGSGRRVLFDDTDVWLLAIGWSPDSRELAFSVLEAGSYIYQEIQTVRADGTAPRRLTNYVANGVSGAPVWSPDGRYIAFSVVPFDSRDVGSAYGVYLMLADGSAPPRQLVAARGERDDPSGWRR